MKRCITLILTICFAATLWGQEARVKDFYANAIDLTAQQTKFQRRDTQGNICALIRVQALVDTLECKGSVIGNTVKKLGEYWVYMPGGAKMVKIQSDAFLPLMYEFPEPLQGGVTYTMVIDVPQRPGTSPARPVAQGYLVVNVTPANAILTVADKEHSAKNGVVKVLLRNGSYTYRVAAPGFFPQEGQVDISGETVSRTVALRSSQPTLSVKTITPGTQIYLNGELRGTGNSSFDAFSGLNEVEGRLPGYHSYTLTVELADGERREVAIPALVPMFGALNVDYEPVGAAISVDGRAAGTTPRVISDILVGDHTIAITSDGYETATLTATVTEGETATLTGTLTKDEKKLDWFYENGKYGFKCDGKVVIAPRYDDAWEFSEGLAWVKQNGKWGYIDKTGREVIPLKYDHSWGFFEGLAGVVLNGKWGYIDKTGREVIPLKYDATWEFSEGLAGVELNGKYSFIDKTGREVIPFKYDGAGSFSEGLAWVRQNGKCGYIDKTGREVIPFKYDGAGSFSEGLAGVELNGKWGYIDKTGREVIPPKYDEAWAFSEGLAGVKLNGKLGYIDKTGREVIPFKYDGAWEFSEGFVGVELNGKWGYIDKTGREVIPLKYDYAWEFSEGLAGVQINGKWGYIDKTGREVIPPKYDEAWDFKNGKAKVNLDGVWFYIDKNGNRVD